MKWAVVSGQLATAAGSVLASAIQGDWNGVAQGALLGALGTVEAFAGVLNTSPLVGVAVSFFTSLVGGLFNFGGNPSEALYEKIMEEVRMLIDQNNIAVRMQNARAKLSSTTEELQHVPEVIKSVIRDPSRMKTVLVSYYLMVQHDLAIDKRLVFGECVDDPPSESCLNLQKAGAVEIGLPHAMTHLALLTSLGEADTSFQHAISLRAQDVKLEYADLLWDSFDTFKDERMSKLSFSRSSAGRARKRCTIQVRDAHLQGDEQYPRPPDYQVITYMQIGSAGAGYCAGGYLGFSVTTSVSACQQSCTNEAGCQFVSLGDTARGGRCSRYDASNCAANNLNAGSCGGTACGYTTWQKIQARGNQSWIRQGSSWYIPQGGGRHCGGSCCLGPHAAGQEFYNAYTNDVNDRVANIAADICGLTRDCRNP